MMRNITAFVLAPLIPATLLWAFSIIFNLGFEKLMGLVFLSAFMSTTIFGLPIFYSLRGKQISLIACCIFGAIITAAPWLVMSRGSLDYILLITLPLLGGIGGLVFWIVRYKNAIALSK
jgi:hypothetical protein